MKRGGIVWFRKDLRIHDNEALFEAVSSSSFIIPIYIFDVREFSGKTSFGFAKTGKTRTNFIIESVSDLKKQFLKHQIELIIKIGKPEEIIFDLAQKAKTSWVFCNRERTQEEVIVQDSLEKNLWSIGQEIRYTKGKMLYYTADLPFPVTQTPDSFSHFRKELEPFVAVRQVLEVDLDTIEKADTFMESDHLPRLKPESQKHSKDRLKGGESTALSRLEELVNDQNVTGNKKSDHHTFSKLSPYLAQGCLSPKLFWLRINPLLKKHKKNKTLQDWKDYLIYRDYCRLMVKKYGNKVFYSTGIQGKLPEYQSKNLRNITSIVNNKTGVPIVDAILLELNYTGYISHQKRRLLASFIHHDLQLDWRIGAELYESLLIDYDVSSNYINWQWVAGIGPNSKETKFINTIKEGQKLDSNGHFIKEYLPFLNSVPSQQIHTPWLFEKEIQKSYNIQLGKDYPKPIVKLNV